MNVLESFSLKGTVVLLTGGAGLYGRQMTAALAEAGAKVYIAARGLEKLQRVAAEERARGFDVSALKLDLSCEKSMRDLCDTIIERSGKIDVLVNNAVTLCADGVWHENMEKFDASMHVNASALFVLTKLAAGDMKKRQRGSIINISSIKGMVGIEMANYIGTDMYNDPSPAYFYEKGGMINFTRFAASVLGKDNIRVNCLSPGGFNTPGQPESFVKAYSERTQLGRMASSSDLKGVIVFLASQASEYITGANIPVDGGYTAK